MRFSLVGTSGAGTTKPLDLEIPDDDLPSVPGTFLTKEDQVVLNHPDLGLVCLRLHKVSTYLPKPDDPYAALMAGQAEARNKDSGPGRGRPLIDP